MGYMFGIRIYMCVLLPGILYPVINHFCLNKNSRGTFKEWGIRSRFNATVGLFFWVPRFIDT